MTIRDRLRQRLTRLSLIVGACVVGMLVGMFRWSPVIWLVAMFIIPALAGAIALGMRFARCPRCGVRMGATARAAARGKPAADVCTHCGVNLDEPIDNLNHSA
jgi:hypothetical protein